MAYNQPPQSALMQLAQGALTGVNNYNQQQAMGMDDFTRQLMSYDPQLALQYQSGTLNKRASVLAEQEQQRLLQKEQQQQSALVALNKEISAGRMDKQSALAALSEITGDPQYIESAFDTSASGGATGALVDRLMAENPNLSYSDALAQVQTGYRQGVTFENGVATPIEGLADARGGLKYAEGYGSTSGDLTAQGQLKPGVEAGVVESKLEAEYNTKGRQALVQQERALRSTENTQLDINKKIEGISQQADPWLTGFTGSLAAAVPGSPAFDLKAQVDTLMARTGFDELQAMRANSPTGAALGSVSERELELLQATMQNLGTAQSYEQFMSNLAEFQVQRQRALQALRADYEADFQRFGGDKTAAPAPGQYNAGAAYNAAQGELSGQGAAPAPAQSVRDVDFGRLK